MIAEAILNVSDGKPAPNNGPVFGSNHKDDLPQPITRAISASALKAALLVWTTPGMGSGLIRCFPAVPANAFSLTKL